MATTPAPRWKLAASDRFSPPTLRNAGVLGTLASRLGGAISGAGRVRGLEVLGRQRAGFLGLGAFIGAVMFTVLNGRERELVILRTTWNIGFRYHYEHHRAGAPLIGVSQEAIDRIPLGPDAPGWTEREAALLQATDELNAERFISDATWARLRQHLPERDIVGMCYLVGLYNTLAMVLNSGGVNRVDEGSWERGPVRFVSEHLLVRNR